MNHAELGAERWARFSLPQQLLQIAAEMHRARSSFESGDDAYLRGCYERALRLVDLTVEVQRDAGLRRELLRWRYFVAGLYVEPRMDRAAHLIALRALLRLDPVSNDQVEILGVSA